MRLFNKVAIIGTGLIGGSLGIFIKKNKLAKEVVGVSRQGKSLNIALKKGAIDKGSLSLEIIKGADFLIIATPVSLIIKSRKDILRAIGKDCIVTDVGSTKASIVVLLEKIFPNYVGSHPLAGSEKHGVAFANKDIFINSLCILTPTPNTPEKVLARVASFWRKAGAKIVFMNPRKHDAVLSFTSHLPHAIAFTLINSIPVNYFQFSSGGLKDTTRIAASNFLLWRDIFLSNRMNTLKAIGLFERNLSKLKTAIINADILTLEKILKEAQKKREDLR